MKEISYLKERVFAGNLLDNEEKSISKNEWIKILGMEVYEKIKSNHKNFSPFLKGEEYTNLFKFDCKDFWEFFEMYACEKKLLECIKGNSIYFEQFYVLLGEYGKRKLKQSIDGKFWTEGFVEEYEKQLISRLQEICIRCLIAKMHEVKSKKNGDLQDQKDLYNYFCRELVGTKEFMKETFKQYPIMLRSILETIENLTNYYKEICENFISNKTEIEKKICKNKKLQIIRKIILENSDVHNCGKQVAKIYLDNGEEIIYKARSMENEYVYNELLQWLARETHIKQREYEFISCENHSWTSIVKYDTCNSQEEIENYYVRLGVQLCLVYILGTKDLHYENLIASGDYPVIIDLENLVNIKCNHTRETAKEEVFYELLQSVLYTGILPFYAWNQTGTGINSSAISGKSGQKYPFRVPVIIDGGTEKMRVEYKYPTSQNKKNIAMLKNEFEDPTFYTDKLIEGFRKAYRSILEKKVFFEAKIKKLENIRCRYLMADTQRYSMLLASSYHPSLLADGAIREIFLYSMWKGRDEKEIVDCEVNELLCGDIPYFYFKMNSTDLLNIRGNILKNYFKKRPMDFIYEKIKMLNENDMEKQCEYIKWVMDASTEKIEKSINRVYTVKDFWIKHNYREKNIKMTIKELTNKLISHAIWNSNHTQVSWSTFQFAANGKTWDVKPMNWYMYDGLAGMLLLLFELKKTNEKVIELYNTVKTMLLEYTDKLCEDWEIAKNNRIGAYDGESSIVYTYLLLGKRGENDCMEYAEKHAHIIEKIVEYDEKYDLISGNAGAAQVMIALYESTKKLRYLQIAENAILQLEETAQEQAVGIGWVVEKGIPPMAGMAHGNSGILIPVLKLWEITKKKKYENLANKICEYEDSLYNPNLKNWEDMREKKGKNSSVGAMAWCHGAPGILLGRMICHQFISDVSWKKRLYDDMEKAYFITNEMWLRDSWSVCHGIWGNYAILSMASSIMNKKSEINKIDLSNMEMELLQQEKLNPGLFNGYGGVLYAALKKNEIIDILLI